MKNCLTCKYCPIWEEFTPYNGTERSIKGEILLARHKGIVLHEEWEARAKELGL